MTAPRPHTSDDDLAFWLKNKGEFSEQPWLNFLLELRDCRAANADALDLVRRLRSEVESEAEHGEPCPSAIRVDGSTDPRYIAWLALPDDEKCTCAWKNVLRDAAAWIAAREAAPPREEAAK